MATNIDIGKNEGHRAAIAKNLSNVPVDSYALYLKTHNFHWNVTQPMFNMLHSMFEQRYAELAQAVDPIAERIRAVVLAQPVEGHEDVGAARMAFAVAKKANDRPTADLLTQRMEIHAKNAWMLRSLLE
jgi:starvation-inducible DNA-binding protein